MDSMILGIDASNIRTGGGVTHLVEVLRSANPVEHGFSQVIVWSGQKTLNQIEDHPWLVKSHQPQLDRSFPFRGFWQYFQLSNQARRAGCDVLLVPGGSCAGDFHPMVTMSQNLLPFEWRELWRYSLSLETIRLLLLRWRQSSSFHKADGLVFLTQYANTKVLQTIKATTGRMAIIPHGIPNRFASPPREQWPIYQYSLKQPFHILYVSIIDMYKHPWHAVEAVGKLRKDGWPVALDLIGPAYPPALARLKRILDRVDPAGEFIQYLGVVPYTELHTRYRQADLFLFASSCENMPIILLEAMASGLPIACAQRGPMLEILGDAGVYFDPEHPDEIAAALKQLIADPTLRARCAEGAYTKAQRYSWERCAHETFDFLRQIAQEYRERC
jgi:glycosyltransferase involved in cell wall biosynthesis